MIDDKTLPAPGPDRQVIQSYGPGRFKVSNAVYEHAVLVLPDRTLRWDARSPTDIDAETLVPLREARGEVEILLIGGSPRAPFVTAELRAWLREAGIVVEAMDTGAACRTYGILVAEGRKVAAALLPIS
ncbi:MAG: Mth938-like domain-containing protein [Reyranellaceae bacterium]